MNMVIWTEYPVSDRDGDNTIYEPGYNIDDETNHIVDSAGFLLADGEYAGFLPYLEKLLDYINTTTSGVLNPQLVNSTLSMGINIQNIIKHEMTIEAEILISVNTTNFLIINRQNA